MDETIPTSPTWGYQPDGSARIFDLTPGESLPDGWNASPDCIADPALATADALTARAAGREYVAAAPLEILLAPPASDAEVARLKDVIETGMAENQRLFEDLDAAESARDAALADAATARATHEHTLTALEEAQGELASLKTLLTKAQEDGGFAVSERDEALKRLDAMSADLAQARADLDAATAPAAPKTAKAR